MALSIAQAQALVAGMLADVENVTAESQLMVGRLENLRNSASALSEGGYRLDVVQSVFGRVAALLRVQREQQRQLNDLRREIREVA